MSAAARYVTPFHRWPQAEKDSALVDFLKSKDGHPTHCGTLDWVNDALIAPDNAEGRRKVETILDHMLTGNKEALGQMVMDNLRDMYMSKVQDVMEQIDGN